MKKKQKQNLLVDCIKGYLQTCGITPEGCRIPVPQEHLPLIVIITRRKTKSLS